MVSPKNPLYLSIRHLFAIHDANRLIAAGDREHRQHRAEDLLRHQRAVLDAMGSTPWLGKNMEKPMGFR